jgi:hypothetical protein
VTGHQSYIRIKIRYCISRISLKKLTGVRGAESRVYMLDAVSGVQAHTDRMHQQKNFTAITFGTVKERLVSR